MNYADSILSLLVPLVVIAMVIFTRRVILSLFVGIVVGAIMVNINDIGNIAMYTYSKISSVLYEHKEGSIELNWYGVYIFLFLIVLGIISQIILYSGATGAFVRWARLRIKTARGSEFLAFIAGIVIFIDDYFNALTVGQISKSLNDSCKSSRERLAYIIDSTSAPICILMPISSWGAYIIGIFKDSSSSSGLDTLVSTIGLNFYAWFALLGVFLTILWQVNLPVMRKNINVDLRDTSSNVGDFKASSIWLLFIPIITLFISISFLIFYTGYSASTKKDSIFDILANTDTAYSLFWGGFLTLIVAFFVSIKHIKKHHYFEIFINGIKIMLPAIAILMLAWAIGPIIKNDIQTGLYLSNLSKNFLGESALVYLPVIFFFISAFMAFSTGTSWGTFAIMIPIVFDMSLTSGIDPTIAISAVLAGAVYGDHTSPISDTTILSSIGAGCSVQSHFITQFPYALIAAICSAFSFFVLSLSGGSAFLAFFMGVLLMVGVFFVLKQKYGGELKHR